MEKIKQLLASISIICLLMIFSSSNLSAQSFLAGSAAISEMQQEITNQENHYASLNPQASNFMSEVSDLKMKIRTLESFLDRIDSNTSALNVRYLLEEHIITESRNFTQIDQQSYDQGNFGSTEMTELQGFLFEVLTN